MIARNEIKIIFFDFGGVLAEEGFAKGLREIARQNKIDPESFIATATEIIYDCGYVQGKNDEHTYWRLVRDKTGIGGDDLHLTDEILSRFTLRTKMFTAVRQFKEKGFGVSILSDQTDWLDRLEAEHHFFREFDTVINSYYTGKTKRDPSVFTDAVHTHAILPHEALFIDDNPGNTGRAAAKGLNSFHFRSETDFLQKIADLL